ncbi:MAG: ParA family protein [Nitrospiria bacterium]
MTERIAVASQKGGVGKTTVSLNMALSLAEQRWRTLLVDLDPQGGIGLSLGRGDSEWAGLTDLLMGQAPIEQAIIQTKIKTLSILPRGRLDPVDVLEFEQAIHQPDVLDKVLNEVKDRFDLIILDTPSGIGMITRSVLAVSDYVLIPFQAEPLALRSISQILRVIEHIRDNENSKLMLLGILPTMIDTKKETPYAVLKSIWSDFEGVFETVIPRVDVFHEASMKGLPVAFLGGPVSPEARRFEMLALEIGTLLSTLKDRGGKNAENPERELL